jgi:hypothetical protein
MAITCGAFLIAMVASGALSIRPSFFVSTIPILVAPASSFPMRPAFLFLRQTFLWIRTSSGAGLAMAVPRSRVSRTLLTIAPTLMRSSLVAFASRPSVLVALSRTSLVKASLSRFAPLASTARSRFLKSISGRVNLSAIDLLAA